ncbi:hypothetical protein Gogos_015552 [Gossypium gossypioides]|uniref:RNase H type-1 domain-containing protein n=1 Tax=Gossypium gossypioides TaxID=34282 RepID=A0A7J9C202_GOSGO|nr:hypothetical protein [Gossypium gossypioides]
MVIMVSLPWLEWLEDCMYSSPHPSSGITWTALETVNVSFSWALQFELSHKGYQHIPQSNASRAPMANTYVQLFTDGAVASGNGSASTRGVLQDQHGNWILGFNHFLERCSIFKAKLWGILDGLLVLVSKTFKRAMIQTNNPEGCKCFTRKFVGRLWYYIA